MTSWDINHLKVISHHMQSGTVLIKMPPREINWLFIQSEFILIQRKTNVFSFLCGWKHILVKKLHEDGVLGSFLWDMTLYHTETY